MRTRNRRLLALGLLAGLACLSFLLFLWLTTPAKSPINWEAYAAIHEGMTEQQVAALLGGPPGNYATDRRLVTGFPHAQGGREWLSDALAVYVWFDAEGTVIAKSARAVG